MTDRGRPVATLGRPMGLVNLKASVDAGWVTPASRVGLPPVRRHRATRSVLQALAEDRAE